MIYVICAIYLCLSVSGLTFMKLGSLEGAKELLTIPIINMKISGLSLIGYTCYIFSFLLYTYIVTKFDLGIIVPLLAGIVNVLVMIVAVFVFKEKFNIYSCIGVCMIIVGIFLINLKK